MKLNDKEKTMLFILSIVIIAVFYLLYLLPPALNEIEALQKEKENYVNQIAEAREVIGQSKAVNDQYKVLNAKILLFSESFFTKLEQERIVLIIDQLLAESGLQGTSMVFKEEVNSANRVFSSDKISEIKSLQDLPCREVTVNYMGSFNKLLKFLGEINNFNNKILVKEINLINSGTQNNTSNLTGNVMLEFYAIPSYIQGANGALTWAVEETAGVSDPFSGASLVAELNTPTDACDFVLTAKPITADLPTVVMGIDADISADSFVFADNPSVEDVELRLFMKDGQYLCSYKTSKEKYPHTTSGVNIPFVNGQESISMKIFSNPRTGEEDQSGINLSLYNETDKPLYIQIINEDPLRPRVSIVQQTSNVIIQ